MAGCVLCLAATLAALGGHWLALQSFAWACMIGDYSKQGSLASAISKTFDGQHPCGLCRTIQQARQQEQTQNKNLPCANPDKTPELFCDLRRTVVPLPPQAGTKVLPTGPRAYSDFIEAPPTPPPRAA